MFMSTFIHLLEASAILLVGVLAFQVYRCYQAFCQPLGSVKNTAGQRRVDVRGNTSSSIASKSAGVTAITVKINKAKSTFGAAVLTNPVAAPIQLNNSESILTDYIGEFFASPSATDIQAYRAEPVLQQVASVNTAATEESSTSVVQEISEISDISTLNSASKPHGTSEQDDFIKVESGRVEMNKLEPVFLQPKSELDAIPTLTVAGEVYNELDDDSVITVMPTAVSSDCENGNVMSDKVVHAMLDEAKLVCAS